MNRSLECGMEAPRATAFLTLCRDSHDRLNLNLDSLDMYIFVWNELSLELSYS